MVLVLGDRNIRRKRPIRHFLVDTGEDLVGDKLALVFVLFAGLGYFITSVAMQDSALLAVDTSANWNLIKTDFATELWEGFEKTIVYTVNFVNQQIPITFDVGGGISADITAYFEFNVNTWLPFVQNQLDLQTVLLITTTMAVLRGMYKQSISAFRLAAVTSMLAVIIQVQDCCEFGEKSLSLSLTSAPNSGLSLWATSRPTTSMTCGGGQAWTNAQIL